MHSSSKTWNRQDGQANKRKRPSAHDFFDELKKRARPEEARAVSCDCSPKTPRESESITRGKAEAVSIRPHPERQNYQDPRQHSPLFVSPSNECQHDNQTQQFTTRDYPLSPLSHSPEHMSDESRKTDERRKLFPSTHASGVVRQFFCLTYVETKLIMPTASRQTLHGSVSTGEVSRSSGVSTSETERGKYKILGKPFTRLYVIQKVQLLTKPRISRGSIHSHCSQVEYSSRPQETSAGDLPANATNNDSRKPRRLCKFYRFCQYFGG